ncbi:MucB/RseB C-terminal domain-containing protein [Alteromonas sp. C1M14]|uniref:MucB/RseB C-terminal domain-containing protein n=1 Tax=Alteromonas sp. C1M14 TaxID=2841567 RepID=UPI001C07F6AA|nr:MucB/RseB C-terminal domain-containing protein [Alteromonas sp. C1M14]MBU2979084.1 MucB/RseB C-terminal domain-containing protein [Alteromonas sp. C1M14]
MNNVFFLNVPALKLVRVFSPVAITLAGFTCLSFSLFAQTLPANTTGVDKPDEIISAESEAPVTVMPDSPTSITGEEHAQGPSSSKPDSVLGWLEKMTNATRTLNFKVAFVVSRLNQETVPYLWRHGVLEDGASLEQLNLQNGPGRELIRVGDVVSIFEPDATPYSLRSKYINGPIPSELLYEPASLTRGYEFVLVGRARVAGRPAQQLRIVSRDNTRFSYQLWLDEATGMFLKLNTLDLQGNILEQIQVTAMDITDAPSAYFSRVNISSLPRPLALPPSTNQPHSWKVEYLPSGMFEVKHDIRRLALTGQVVEYKMFTDGLVDVSVYVQSAKEAVGSDLVLRHELNTFLTLTDGKAQVTVVGEIPLKTANAIATSLRLKGDTND